MIWIGSGGPRFDQTLNIPSTSVKILIKAFWGVFVNGKMTERLQMIAPLFIAGQELKLND